MSSAESDALRRLLERGRRAGRFSGAAFGRRFADPAVAGANVEIRVGRTSVDDAAPAIDATSRFDLASLTKPLATARLLQARIADARIDPAAPASRLVPELRGGPYEAVSVDALARHTGGLPAWAPLAAIEGGLDAWLPRIARLTPAVPAGTTLYSDPSYLLLQAVLEREDGRSLREQFDDDPMAGLGFRPVGRADDPTCVATEDGNRHERELAGEAPFPTRGRIPRGEVHDTHAWALGGAAGHAGLFGTLEAVLALGVRLVTAADPGRGARFDIPPAGGRTFGWQAATDCAAVRGLLPARAVGHLGFTGTSLWLDPGRGVAWALLTNRVHPRVPRRPFAPFRRAVHRLGARPRMV